MSLPDAISTSLTGVIADAVRCGIARIHTSMPAKVVAYNAALQTVSVQPSVQFRYLDEDEVEHFEDYPVLSNVPVLFWQATGYALTFPLSPGDPVTLFFSERSTDEWRALGAASCTPRDARRFDLSDAVAVPGGIPGRIPATGYGAGMVLEGSMQLGSSAAVLAPVLESFLVAIAASPGLLTEIIAIGVASAVPTPQTTALKAAILANQYKSLKVRAE